MTCSERLAARIRAAEAKCDKLRNRMWETDEDLCVIGPRPHLRRAYLKAEIKLIQLQIKAADEEEAAMRRSRK